MFRDASSQSDSIGCYHPCPQVNVDVQYAGPTSGHIVVAQQDLRRGDLIASIPLQLTYVLHAQGGNDTFEVE